MTRTPEDPITNEPDDAQRSERERLETAFGGYAADAAKQRAWSAANPGNAAMRAEVLGAVLPLAHASAARGLPVLDAGCGGGWWLRRLADEELPQGVLAGVDLLPDRVAAARRLVPAARVLAADVRALPFGDGEFGLVLLLTALSSLATADDVASALAEVRRTSAPGGEVVIWEPRLPTPGNANTRLITRRAVAEGLGPGRLRVRSVTLAPPLARRVGPAGNRALGRVPLLRTHRLLRWTAPQAPASAA